MGSVYLSALSPVVVWDVGVAVVLAEEKKNRSKVFDDSLLPTERAVAVWLKYK